MGDRGHRASSTSEEKEEWMQMRMEVMKMVVMLGRGSVGDGWDNEGEEDGKRQQKQKTIFPGSII